jgi:hypothetical protein
MKLYDGGIIIIGILIAALAVGYASSKCLGDDNPVEETAEVVIREQTGVGLDLTPSSTE